MLSLSLFLYQIYIFTCYFYVLFYCYFLLLLLLFESVFWSIWGGFFFLSCCCSTEHFSTKSDSLSHSLTLGSFPPVLVCSKPHRPDTQKYDDGLLTHTHTHARVLIYSSCSLTLVRKEDGFFLFLFLLLLHPLTAAAAAVAGHHPSSSSFTGQPEHSGRGSSSTDEGFSLCPLLHGKWSGKSARDRPKFSCPLLFP